MKHCGRSQRRRSSQVDCGLFRRLSQSRMHVYAFDQESGAEAEKVSISASATFSAVAFPSETLSSGAIATLADQAPAGYVLDPASISFDVPAETSASDGSRSLIIPVAGEIPPEFGKDQADSIAAEIAGMTDDEAQTAILAMPGIETVSITYEPDWLFHRLPHDADRIEVQMSTMTRVTIPTGAALGLDFGERRIGVAVSDSLGMIASPVTAIPTGNGAVEALRKLIDRYDAVLLVAGLPRGLSGKEGPQAARVREQAEAMALEAGYRSNTGTSGLTTTMANRSLKETGHSERESRHKVDAVAASLMLQSYLDAAAIGRSPRTL